MSIIVVIWQTYELHSTFTHYIFTFIDVRSITGFRSYLHEIKTLVQCDIFFDFPSFYPETSCLQWQGGRICEKYDHYEVDMKVQKKGTLETVLIHGMIIDFWITDPFLESIRYRVIISEDLFYNINEYEMMQTTRLLQQSKL